MVTSTMSDGEETHWCYRCYQRFGLHGQEVICPSCNGGFVEELTGIDDLPNARKYVVEVLTLYRDIFRELSQEKSKAGKESSRIRSIDLRAAKELKQITGYVHAGMQFVGHVPGVEVGDTFYYRMELVVVGLHRLPQSGIDYMGSHPDILATSVVAPWDYTDDLSKPDELVYVGQGGMPANDKKAEDQKLTRGNLALVNSMERKKPVRVIRKDRDHTFTYDGLYMVESCRKLCRANRQMVFEFLMKRIPGQPTAEYFMPNSGDIPPGMPYMLDIVHALTRQGGIGSRRGFRDTAGSMMREAIAGRNPNFAGRRHLNSVPEEARDFLPSTHYMSFHGQIPDSAFLHHSRANGPRDTDFDTYFMGAPGLEELIDFLSVHNQGGPAPAPPSAIDAMPTIKVTQTHLRADADCPVCKEEFELGSEVRMMPCHHIYHSGCIIPWLLRHNSCPVCRFEMPAQGSDGSSHNGMGNPWQTHGTHGTHGRSRHPSSRWHF